MDRAKLDIQLTILKWYEAWSEEHYASGFMTPDQAAVRAFVRHIGNSLRDEQIPLETYETAMLGELAVVLNDERLATPQ